MTLQQTLDDFMFSRKIQGCTEKSLECYHSFCMPFVNYLGENMDISLINKNIVNKYIETLFNRQLARATISTYIRHIKIFLCWIESEYEVNIQTDRIKVPKMPKKVLHIYNSDEIRLIFQSVTADEDWIVARNKCIIAFT